MAGMTDKAKVVEATQEQFCTYCEALSDVFDQVLARHGPHVGLNTASALLGYALYRVGNPARVEALGDEVLELSARFARDMWERDDEPVQ